MKISGCRMGFIYTLFWVIFLASPVAWLLYGFPDQKENRNYGDNENLAPLIIIVNPANAPSMPMGF